MRAGVWLWHPRFGLGRVQALRDGGASVRVRFVRLLQPKTFDIAIARRVGPGVVPEVVPAVALPRP